MSRTPAIPSICTATPACLALTTWRGQRYCAGYAMWAGRTGTPPNIKGLTGQQCQHRKAVQRWREHEQRQEYARLVAEAGRR